MDPIHHFSTERKKTKQTKSKSMNVDSIKTVKLGLIDTQLHATVTDLEFTASTTHVQDY